MGELPEQNLRIPGPTPLPLAVRQALGRQMINHRGPEYAEMQAEVLDGLRHFFGTAHDLLLFSSSGTGGLEAAVVNTLSPGDEVLAVSIGVFGERFARIAEAFGAQVHRLEAPWGEAVQRQSLADALARWPKVAAVLLTCNETSTGVINHLAALAPVVKERGDASPLLLVDGVSAVGAVDLPMDDLGIDVLVSGSQKAWMAPPGIAMLGISPRAWQAHAQARMPRFYWDFTTQRKAQQKGQDAWTPALSTVYALHTSLRMMREEGREAIIARHARIAAQTQRGLEALGLQLLAAPGHRSPTVSAAYVPDGISAQAVLAHARQEHQVVLAAGQERLADSIIRLGHMGWVEEAHIAQALEALAASLVALGHRLTVTTASR